MVPKIRVIASRARPRSKVFAAFATLIRGTSPTLSQNDVAVATSRGRICMNLWNELFFIVPLHRD